MKKQILKIVTVILLIMVLTMTNFIFVGSSFISYATDNMATNQTNVKFSSYFKDQNGNKLTTKETNYKQTEEYLYLQVEVNKEGYLNGQVELEEGANFKLVSSESEYVEKVEANRVSLYNMTAGTSVEIPVKIEPIKEEQFNIGLLNVESKITLTGTYKDSTEKEKNVSSTRTVSLKFVDEISQEYIINEIKTITNKIIPINGEEKRIVQLEWNIGLTENNYPIKEIVAKIETPAIEGITMQVEKQITLNTMTSYEEKNENEILLKNEPTSEGTITWKKSGTENIILTYIYDKDADTKNITLNPEIKITLYNQKEISATTQTAVEQEEQDAVVTLSTKNQENEIYNGKLIAGIERSYITRTSVKVNLAEAIEKIEIQENASTYIVNEVEMQANIFYTKTMIKKEQFDKILGENGKITITNEAGEILGTIDASTTANQDGYLNIDYTEKEVKSIKITTTAPIAEGTLEINHLKTAKETDKNIVKVASNIDNTIFYSYNQENAKQTKNSITLKAASLQSKLDINKDQLSTVVENDIEMKITLQTNSEKYLLFENPEMTLEMPEEIENIEITKIEKIYDDNQEFENPNYTVNGRNIYISLKGKQAQYKEGAVEGIAIVINAKIKVNKKAATSDEQIKMTYKSQEELNETVVPIKIIAPKDITAVNSIKELAIETIGEEEQETVMMEKGTRAKQLKTEIEVINSNSVAINDVKILGDFPTNNSTNNMGVSVLGDLNIEGTNNAKVYYSSNENATDDLNDSQNGWNEKLSDGSSVKKYLITLDGLETASSIQGSYQMQIPENLEYNLNAVESYSVTAINSETNTETTLNATTIVMETGIGPKLETKLTSTVGGSVLSENGTVKNGEVIKYKIEVSNTGSEEVTGATFIGQVPDGTTLVEPVEDYEYAGTTYYVETDKTTYESTIETIKPGEVITKEYEVRVNSNTPAGTTLENKTQVKYGEAVKENTITNKTENGNLRISVKRVTDREIQLYSGTIVNYYVIVENISGSKQENVKVEANATDNLEIIDAKILGQTGETSEEISKVDLGSLEVNETKTILYSTKVTTVEDSEIEFSAKAKDAQNTEYRSNQWQDKTSKYQIALDMESNTKSSYVKAGDTIEYIIKVENKGQDVASGVSIVDEIPKQLTITKVTIDGEEVELPETNDISLYSSVEGNETSLIKIETIVEDSLLRTQAEPITNIATAQIDGEQIATTSEINHIIEARQTSVDTGNENNNGEEDNTNNDVENNDIAKGNKLITGMAWYDENADGKKDQGEELLTDIKVRLLNAETNNLVKDQNGNILEATTNSNGMYVLNNIANGKYIVIFDYDTTKYALTKYKVQGVLDSQNSNAMTNELTIEGNNQKVASTDIVEISNNNISNINIGLIKLQNFDLQLDKYVSKILIQDSTGSTVKQYDNSKVAKVELDAKKINGSTVIIEYTIKVTNNGEIDGYAKKIADYMPSDLKFSSELNKDWYQSENTLYNASLANEKIAAGESKTVTLTLTKSMTEDSTGLIYNTAEIAEDYNELGIADSNSQPGNKAKGENDLSEAEVILSIRTGGIVYISIAIIIILILGTVTFILIKKKAKREI